MKVSSAISICFSLIVLVSCNGNTFDGKNGLKVVYFPGTDDTCQVIEYKDGKKNGNLKEFFENGNLKTIQHYKDDKQIDTAVFFHPNGKKAGIQMYNNGLFAGCWEKFNEEGKLYSKICFDNGVFDGEALTYSYKSLNLIERYHYNKGDKQGVQETFYNSGKPKSIAYYYWGLPGLGTREWLENGTEINNDFGIHYTEQDKVKLENNLYVYVTLDDPEPDDVVYKVSTSDTGNVVTTLQRLEKTGDKFTLRYSVYPGGFVMEKVKLAAYRKTGFGNTFIKTISFNVSANNY